MTSIKGMAIPAKHAASEDESSLTLQSPNPHQLAAYFRWKRAFDITTALLLCIPCLPIIVVLTILVRLTSRGPGIFPQERVGKDGAIFTMYKIRTMAHDAESKTGPAWSQDNDPRVTRIGKILRHCHLDEFPQLFNVLMGQMSMIGPRPERPEFVSILSREITDYKKRLFVQPGITGLAQINLPPDSDLDSVRQKLELDVDYVNNASLGLDLRLLLFTGLRMLGLQNKIAAKWLKLHRSPRHTTPADEWENKADDKKPTSSPAVVSWSQVQGDVADEQYPLAATPTDSAGAEAINSDAEWNNGFRRQHPK